MRIPRLPSMRDRCVTLPHFPQIDHDAPQRGNQGCFMDAAPWRAPKWLKTMCFLAPAGRVGSITGGTTWMGSTEPPPPIPNERLPDASRYVPTCEPLYFMERREPPNAPRSLPSVPVPGGRMGARSGSQPDTRSATVPPQSLQGISVRQRVPATSTPRRLPSWAAARATCGRA